MLLSCAGLWWGPRDTQPILALHGWLDNAATFDPLMALLPANLSILALDMPGHGLSSHYPPGCMYHYSEDIVTLRRIIKNFGWEKISIMGHSMGSTYAFLYAAFFPRQVDKIIGFDIIRPYCLDTENFIKTGGADIDQFLNLCLSQKEPPEYTVEELIERQYKASTESISRESCRVLLTRGGRASEKSPAYIRLTRDIRLKYFAFLHCLPHEFLIELASRIQCEVLNIKGRQGMFYEPKEYYQQTLDLVRATASRLEYHEVEGSHHVHLNNPENLAHIVTAFLT